MNFTEPLQLFFRKSKTKITKENPHRYYAKTNDLAFQHKADVIHPCNKSVQPN